MSVLEGWQAMRITRKHTLPHHRAENLAEHSWGVLHILMYVYPDAPTELIKAAMYHDIGEHRSGDIPGDFKQANPEVRTFSESYEILAAKRVLPEYLHDALEPEPDHALLLKICDKVEFAFSCYHEWMLGNRYAVAPMGRTMDMARDYVNSNEEIFREFPDHLQSNILRLLAEASRLYAEARDATKSGRDIHYASE